MVNKEIEDAMEDLHEFRFAKALDVLIKYFKGEYVGEFEGIAKSEISTMLEYWAERFYPSEASQVPVDISNEDMVSIAEAAMLEDVTINQWVVMALENQIERMEKDNLLVQEVGDNIYVGEEDPDVKQAYVSSVTCDICAKNIPVGELRTFNSDKTETYCSKCSSQLGKFGDECYDYE